MTEQFAKYGVKPKSLEINGLGDLIMYARCNRQGFNVASGPVSADFGSWHLNLARVGISRVRTDFVRLMFTLSILFIKKLSL